MNSSNDKICTFCGKYVDEVNFVTASTDQNIGICFKCVEQCDIYQKTVSMSGSVRKDILDKTNEYFLPFTMKKYLDRYIVGHEKTKRLLSAIFTFHHIRINNLSSKLKKHNLLIIGPTGSGKTMLVETLASYMELPFVAVDATSYTASGYIGEDVSGIATQLLESAYGNVSKAERGIVFIDEVDKLVPGTNNIGKDVSGTSVQQELLKFIEGKKVSISTDSKLPKFVSPTTTMNTHNILFILAGCFDGLEHNKYQIETGLGLFSSGHNTQFKKDINLTKGLIDYGLLGELVGRIENFTIIDALTKSEMLEILVGTEKPLLKDFELYLNKLGLSLNITRPALEYIAEQASLVGLGARGLSKQLSDLILPNICEYAFDVENSHHETIKLIVDIDPTTSKPSLLLENSTEGFTTLLPA